MNFTAKDVSILRERTGCGMMDCKRALVDADGEMDKAVELLRERGLAKAAKKAGRIAAEGLVSVAVDINKSIGAIIEINSETDFVAKNQQFKDFVTICEKTVLENKPADIDGLLKCNIDGNTTVELSLQEKIATIGENIVIRRFGILEGSLGSYVHGEGKIAVLVRFETDVFDNENFQTFAKDIAMQIAAMNPIYINKADVPADDIEKEKEILFAQIKQDAQMASKPDQVIEKMVIGRLNKKFYQESCLVEQVYVKDASITVGQYIADSAKSMGGSIKVSEFLRYEKGEGIEKKEDNFAAEIADMIC